MADDRKRSETVSTKVTEQVALDLLREAAIEDRSPSEYVYLLIRRHLYGKCARRAEIEQTNGVHDVNHEARTHD